MPAAKRARIKALMSKSYANLPKRLITRGGKRVTKKRRIKKLLLKVYSQDIKNHISSVASLLGIKVTWTQD